MRNYYKFTNLNLDEANIFDLQEAMEQGNLTSRDLVFYYLTRIAEYDQDGPNINAVMEINPDAIFLAEALDVERRSGGRRGLLHGVPILLKDNIGTHDKMHTSAGALALAQHISPEDAFVVRKLRQAGAIILGKTNMTEWANGISSSMWAGYSSRGGQVAHPYGEFFAGGSSTGSAAAAAMNFAAAAVGTETSASILSPAVQMSVVGIKPTVGLISRTGIIPFSYSQDTAGPLARTVSDAAILLGVLAGRDENDPATWRYEGSDGGQDYTGCLNVEGLRGARIGIYCDVPEHVLSSGEIDEFLFDQAVSDLTKAGAQVVKPIEIPSFHGPWKYNKINMEFKHGIQNFLHNLPAHMPIHSLSELIHWNQNHKEQALRYGQDILEYREGLTDLLNDRKYIQESVLDLHLAQREGIDHAIDRYQLDAIMFPAYIGADLSARAGYPSIAVPAGYMENGRPFGVTFAGKAFSEPALIAIAYSFEQHTKHRKQPVFD
ncbi:amidase family protein [Paenibacillus sonchi]|uniref:amidase family protein n=1 Tax=Paenibacillus sonchi TaxID=373687 RepID=UPI001E646603|nr:amidase family protein [Paenibacillus sonchi]MCE3200966.1 amidase [Paenibacillus sonchi]